MTSTKRHPLGDKGQIGDVNSGRSEIAKFRKCNSGHSGIRKKWCRFQRLAKRMRRSDTNAVETITFQFWSLKSKSNKAELVKIKCTLIVKVETNYFLVLMAKCN